MKNMRLPTRPAPSLEEARRKQNKNVSNQTVKKKPPPRPPPPNFSKTKSKSAWNLNQPSDNNICLFDWSPPSSPKSTNRNFGGSISSSFSSSTSSLASSKKSFEYDTSPFNVTPWNNITVNNAAAQGNITPTNPVVPQISVPTIIRAQPPKRNTNINCINMKPVLKRYTPTPPLISVTSHLSGENSPPMPSIPPPSPPKVIDETVVPFGIALYDFPGSQSGDLPLQENDIVLLLKLVNKEWYYGKIDDREGIFPANFVDVQIPLPEDFKFVRALYEFHPEMPGDLRLSPGDIVKVLQKVSNDWLLGEFNGQKGQFPANFVVDV